jgi:hypothetical protein
MSGTEGRWWRPALQLPGLAIMIAAMLPLVVKRR